MYKKGMFIPYITTQMATRFDKIERLAIFDDSDVITLNFFKCQFV